ncbi:zinc finger protein sfp1 [Phaffia rhodozyma]|uniref:Zinc finger protein sfp1 n=1 Tax=Phaffia rhodozyma TaxID=264483 RepID=A0A0F7SEP2_PHARH|nr:zinc finger protein sfp1 [Phaffia rhodozyma]
MSTNSAPLPIARPAASTVPSSNQNQGHHHQHVPSQISFSPSSFPLRNGMLSPSRNLTSNPIPLPVPSGGFNRGGTFPSGSYNNSGSLARSFRMGSMMNSFEDRMQRMGSWKGKFVGSGDIGGPWLAGGIDAHDFSTHFSTSMESVGGSSMKMARREADYCQNYNCCGLELSSMHDLLEHYEDVHVIILSPSTNASQLPSHDIESMDLEADGPSSSSQSSGSSASTASAIPSSVLPQQLKPQSSPLNRAHPIPLGFSSPRTSSNLNSPSNILHRTSQPSNPAPLQLSDVLAPPSNSAFETSVLTSFPPSGSDKKTKQALAGRAAFVHSGSGVQIKDEGWNALADGAKTPTTVWEGEYRYPSPGQGSNLSSAGGVGGSTSGLNGPFGSTSTINNNPSAMPPTLLFSSQPQPKNSTAPLSPSSAAAQAQAAAAIAASMNINDDGEMHSLTITPGLAHPNGIPPPASANQKLHHCPTPGCNKSYKQQNGLKYHLKVGQCDFNVRDGVENGLSEEQAEEKSRPYQCQVGGGCTKRYRQMNGLRYHYLNSAAHGAIGLALIQQGKHPNPKGGELPSSMGVGPVSGFKLGSTSSLSAIGGTAVGGGTNGVVGGLPRPGNWPLHQLAPQLQQQLAQQSQVSAQFASSKSDLRDEMLFTVKEDEDMDMDMD